jgi:hypothetical protein
MLSLTLLACLGVGLALTLCACAWLTPRSWWRRPNLRALGALSLGTAAIAAALYAFVNDPAAPAPMAAAVPDAPKAGTRYRVHDGLNLRIEAGVGARRLAVVPAGSRLVATGRHDGDWWQVRAVVNGREVEGWASSLWLRRSDEGPVQASSSETRRIGL